MNNTALVTLLVEDVNDNNPVFNDSIKVFNVSEDTEKGIVSCQTIGVGRFHGAPNQQCHIASNSIVKRFHMALT